MIDVLFLAHGRAAFTREALRMLAANTDLSRVRLVIYTDGEAFDSDLATCIDRQYHGGPVAIMNQFLYETAGFPVFAKIDNDTIVPPGWLDRAAEVMETHRELDLLGIEPPASRTPAPWARGKRIPAPELGKHALGYAPCDAIGGIGLMRRRAFSTPDRMRPHSIHGGFTDWQLRHPEIVKGWITPPLNVFLLDRLPIDPWAVYSRKYIRQGDQRAWTNYSAEDADLWEWWSKEIVASGK